MDAKALYARASHIANECILDCTHLLAGSTFIAWTLINQVQISSLLYYYEWYTEEDQRKKGRRKQRYAVVREGMSVGMGAEMGLGTGSNQRRDARE
jgi:hypothetical protein